MHRPPSQPTRTHARRWSMWLCLGMSLFAVVAAGGACLPFKSVRRWLDQQAGDGSADPYTPELHQRLSLTLIILSVLLALAAGLVWRYADQVRGRIHREVVACRRLVSRLCPSDRRVLACMLGAGLVATLIRAEHLVQPMRFDEAYTDLQYAAQPLYVTASKYDAPNNHVAHSVLVWGSTRIFGNSPPAIRLPAFLAGVLTAVATCCLAGRWGGPTAGLLAGLVVSAWSPLVEYSVNARGYTLLHLLVVLMLLVADEWLARPRRPAAIAMGILGGLALWTIPTAAFAWLMLLSMLALCTVGEELPARRHRRWRELLLFGLLTILVSLFLYSPILLVSGWRSLIPGQAESTQRIVWSLADELRQGSISLLFRDQSPWSCGALSLGFALALLSNHQRLRRFARHWLMGIGACIVLVLLLDLVPPGRTWLFLIPWGVPIAVCGLYELMLKPQRLVMELIGTVIVGLVCAVVPLVELRRNDSVNASQETGVCPDAAAIIRDFRDHIMHRTEPILATSPTSAPLVYYAQREGLDLRHFDPLRRDVAIPAEAYVVLSRVPQQSVQGVLEELRLEGTYSVDTRFVPRVFPSAWVYRVQRTR